MLTMVIVTRFLHFSVTNFFILVHIWSKSLSEFPKENVSKLGIDPCVQSEKKLLQ